MIPSFFFLISLQKWNYQTAVPFLFYIFLHAARHSERSPQCRQYRYQHLHNQLPSFLFHTSYFLLPTSKRLRPKALTFYSPPVSKPALPPPVLVEPPVFSPWFWFWFSFWLAFSFSGSSTSASSSLVTRFTSLPLRS